MSTLSIKSYQRECSKNVTIDIYLPFICDIRC